MELDKINVTWKYAKITDFTKALEYLTLLKEIPDISIDDVRYEIYNYDSKKIKTRTFAYCERPNVRNLGRKNSCRLKKCCKQLKRTISSG